MQGKNTEQISSWELFSTTYVFIISVSMILPAGALAGHNSWISIIVGLVIGLGYAWIYTSLCDFYPGKSIIEIGEILMGRWAGKIIALLYFWFSFQLSALVMSDHWKFAEDVALPNTPVIVLIGTMMLLIVFIVYSGIEAIGRVSTILAPLIVIAILATLILLIKDMDFRNLLPIFYDKWRETMYSGLQISTLPFGEGVLFAMVFPHLRKRGRSKTPTLFCFAVAGLLILTLNIRNTLVFGGLNEKFTYPTYAVYAYIQIADFIDRAEIIIYPLFTSAIFIKMSVSFYVAAISLAKVLNTKDYRTFLIPLGFLVSELSMFIYKSQAEVINVTTLVWPWYSMLFIFFIPLMLLILAAFVKRNGAKSA